MGNGAIKAQNLCVARSQPEAQIQIQIQLETQIQLHISPQLQSQRLVQLQLQLQLKPQIQIQMQLQIQLKLRPCISLVHWLFGAEPALVHAMSVWQTVCCAAAPSSSDIYKYIVCRHCTETHSLNLH